MSDWTPDDPKPAVIVAPEESRGLHTARTIHTAGYEAFAVLYLEPAKIMARAFRTYHMWDSDADLMRELKALGPETVVYLQRIQTEPLYRGQGLGTYLLKAVLAWIDEQRLITFLHAMPYGLRDGPCVAELENWYFRFGFRGVATEEDADSYIDKSYVLMRRDARR